MPPRRSARKAQATDTSGDPTNGNVDTSTVADDGVDVTTVKEFSATRKSTRSRKKATIVDSVQAPSTVSTTTMPADVVADPSKPGKKRTRSDDSDEKEDKPASKKSKKNAKTVDDKNIDQKKDASKMVTVLKRGAVPVDPASSFVSTYQVYVSPGPDGEIWDAMLNQTNIGKNANKFYVLQLLHPLGDATQCILFLRWGRTGENGASQTKGPWPTSLAINEFKKQFRSKTATPWEQRIGMTAKPGKYTWLERDYNTIETDGNGEGRSLGNEKVAEKPVSVKVPESTLVKEVQTLCSLIFNIGYINAALSSMNYDANKLPLGKLSKATILQGFAALKALSEVIENSQNASQYGGLDVACAELSNQYYSIIPHVFGRSKPIVINTMQQLKKELELVDALGDMEIAQKLINEKADANWDGEPINPLDARFKSLQLESMEPVVSESKEFAAIAAYARDTHGDAHSYYKVTVQNVFRVKRRFEDENWTRAGFDNLGEGQRLLLWHGSRSTNFAGILSQGLRIAPPEAPVNGYMFGKGVYFADMMSKSYNYCYPSSSGNIGILLLCEVAAKPCHEFLNACYNADEECKNAGKLSTKGIGRNQPVDWQDAGEALDNEELDGCLMPKGPAKEVNPPGSSLWYNEYIIYNTAQIRVKYLLMVKMN